jgi:DME family drug/metabolite transporter
MCRVVSAAVLFGTTGVALQLAGTSADPLAFGSARLAVGGGLLWVTNRRHPASLNGVAVRARIIGAAIAMVLFQFLAFVAIHRAGVAVATVVSIGSGPVWAGIITATHSRTPPAASWCAGSALAIGGVWALSGATSGDHVDILGVLAALGAGLGWSAFTLSAESVVRTGAPTTSVVAAVFATAGVIALPVLLMRHAPLLDGRGAAIALYLGTATIAGGYTLFGRALATLSAPTVITLTLAEPIAASILAAVVLGQPLTPLTAAGAALVITGLMVSTRPGHLPRLVLSAGTPQ